MTAFSFRFRPSKGSEGASKNLVMKAVADADKSIGDRRREERRRDEELEAIHRKRMQLSKAMRAGNLVRDIIKRTA